ncbi:ATP-binding protein [Malikia granosa]|uniref:histidine kinase n=1 Tax=Malikia granosa TaxID=263067 RepID=A0A2S9K5Y8_9BURK|nr:ATP-binding protein [Malikia granosa]PRD65837.1 HAMP domain-containing histidine kinase [Malikia granosa]
MKARRTLLQQHTLGLMVAFVVLELVLAIVFLALLVVPLARRAADDLAGLVVLSAQTWSELPPETRPAFVEELRANHGLEIRQAHGSTTSPAVHPPFVYLFEQSINRRLPQSTHLLREQRAGEVWYWVNIPVGDRELAVGWPENRNDSKPLIALGVGLLCSLWLSWWSARWLARRIVQPLSSLGQAMAAVGEGGTPTLLPEDGPQELAAVSRQFNVMVQQVQVLLTARTTMLAGVSHDLRTPLTRMRLALELLRDTPTPALLDRMEREVERMNQLITQVMELARGLEAEPPQQLDLNMMFASLQEDFKDEKTPLQTRCDVGTVWAAPLALRRILSNLIQNAQRYASGHPVRLVSEPGLQGTRIGVLDQGPGIPLAELDRMQLPFQRLEASRNQDTGGFGLGLAIVRELAKANGWQLQWISPPEGGLQAWITLASRHEGQETLQSGYMSHLCEGTHRVASRPQLTDRTSSHRVV